MTGFSCHGTNGVFNLTILISLLLKTMKSRRAWDSWLDDAIFAPQFLQAEYL